MVQPTKQEQEEHRITHLPYKSWCPICVKAKGQPTHHRRGALKEQSVLQLDYAYIKSNLPTNKKWQVDTILTGVETTIGLCLAIPTTIKERTNKENSFGHTTKQVDNELAIQQHAQEAARELTIPWRHSSSHSHQGQGAVERFHKTVFAQCRAIRFDLVDRYILRSPDNVPGQNTTCTWFMLMA
eukprot:6111189-Amphidinium_carterae.2